MRCVRAFPLRPALPGPVLSLLAVTPKGTAVRICGHGSARSIWIGNAIEILGAVLVICMGVLLLGASLQG
ncbi:delayed-early response protein/equilibrative nucleoside transporter, partial [Rhizobium sp. SEMIA 4085]|nr:delayed-early response protein/equilibrative nucleoside transporter [Rhizobium sp. SEMIA 4085]